MTTELTTTPAFDEWCIAELLGHRRVAGRVREAQLAGAGFLRLDIPATEGHGEQTQYIAPGSVYALHPVDEATARAVAAYARPEPVHRWELPAAAVPDDSADESGCTCVPGFVGEGSNDCPVHSEDDDQEGGPF